VVGLPVTVVANRENRGFAAACNQGAAGSDARYLLFLNPDTILLPGALEKPLEFMESGGSGDVGICGIQLLDENGGVARSCSRFPTTLMFLSKMLGLDRILPAAIASQPMAEWDHRTDRDVDQVIGAFFLVRRDLFELLGGFDERFFVYFEEVDFSLRAAAEGFRTHFLSEARAVHRGGGCTDQVRARRLSYEIGSRCAYAWKNFSRPSAVLLVAASLTLEPLVRLAASILRGPPGSFGETLDGFRMAWASVLSRAHQGGG
jgi:N-acetylglucosaminyl-diphospho-decaprenol L-rhamnosyltransferase